MKPQLETIHLAENQSSFKVFRLELPGFPPYWHYHPQLELTYIQKGSGLRFIGDHIAPFEDGDLVFVGENLPHQWVSQQSSVAATEKAVVIQFSRSLFESFKECKPFLGLFRNAKYGLRFKDLNETFIRKLNSLPEQQPVQRLMGLLDILYDLSEDQNYELLSSISYSEKTVLDKHQNRISAITTFIINHYDQSLSLEQMARIAGISPPSFCRWFKQSVGKSFVHYLNTIRIEKACQQLLQTDWPIYQIAYKSGFESLNNFNRTFKKYKKESPRSYRKQRKIS